MWTLANISAGKSTQTKLVLHKSLKSFIRLFDDVTCPNEIKSDIIWTFANIAGDSVHCRNELITARVLTRVLDFLKNNRNSNYEKNCIWFITNFFRYQEPPADIENVTACLPFLSERLEHQNQEIVCNVCWSLKYIAGGSTRQAFAVIEAGICETLKNLLQ